MSVVANVPRSIALQPQNPSGVGSAEGWDPLTVYNINEIVSYSAVLGQPNLYVAVALTTTAGEEPATVVSGNLVVSEEWRLCAKGEPMWVPGQSYYPGDVVSYASGGGGTDDTEPSLYMCLVATGAVSPSPPAPVAGFTSEYWKLLVSSGGGTVGVSSVITGAGSGLIATTTPGGQVQLTRGLLNGYGISLGAGVPPPNPNQLYVGLNYYTDYGCGIDILSPSEPANPADPLYYSANLIGGALVSDGDPLSPTFSTGFGGGVLVTRNTTESSGEPNNSSRQYATSISLTANLTTANGCGIQTIPSSTTSALGLATNLTTPIGSGMELVPSILNSSLAVKTNFTTANGCGLTLTPALATSALGLATNLTTATGCGLSLAPSGSTTGIALSANLVAGSNIALTPSSVPGNTSIVVSSATPQLSTPYSRYHLLSDETPVFIALNSDGFTEEDTFAVVPNTTPYDSAGGGHMTSYFLNWVFSGPTLGWTIQMVKGGASAGFSCEYIITALTKNRQPIPPP